MFHGVLGVKELSDKAQFCWKINNRLSIAYRFGPMMF